MNFEFDEEHNLLRDQAARMLAEKSDMSVVRAVLEGEESYSEPLWRLAAEQGWMAVAIPEEFGGLAMDRLALCVLAEELGRALAPIPFSSSVYLATEALLMAGTRAQQEAWLPKLAAGDAIGTFALAERHGRQSPSLIETSASSRGRLTGTKLPVADGDVADFAVVVSRCKKGDGASLWLVDLSAPEVSVSTVNTLDPSRSHAQVVLAGVPAEPLGAEGEGWTLTQKLFDQAAVLFAWEQVGGADRALNMARDYAMQRYAFGRPIASFQAIKHKLAEAYVKNTLARSNCYFGAWALDTGASELPIAAATARVSATQAFYYASKENIQTHGGMGFTWEFDCQFLYRRAKLLSVNIGSEASWQEKLITAVEQSNLAA